MKSQDVLLLLKLESLRKQEARFRHAQDTLPEDSLFALPYQWQDWEPDPDTVESELWGAIQDQEGVTDTLWQNYYTVRNLELETGISKTQISESLRRNMDCGLIRIERGTGIPRANTKALFEFLVYGIRYVFPVKPAELTRGIATSFTAPVLKQKLIGGGELQLVWADPRANSKGLSITPLYKSVPAIVRKDALMYAMLSLIDAIRLGNPRETALATNMLDKLMRDPQ